MNVLSMTPEAFAKLFDHTLLKPDATKEAFDHFCQEGLTYGFKMLAINPAAVTYCKEKTKGSDLHVGAAIGFPLGQNTVETKVFETIDAIEKGADEIDYVINIVALKNKDYDLIQNEMAQIVAICKEKDVISKVIFENCYLTNDEKKILCEIANKIKPDFIKTATGFGTGGATVEDVKLMRQYADPVIAIKASSGIRTLADCIAMVEAGATRIGTSASVSILKEFLVRQ